MMDSKIEEALRNINTVCASVRLTRQEHLVLADNIALSRQVLEAYENAEKTQLSGDDKGN